MLVYATTGRAQAQDELTETTQRLSAASAERDDLRSDLDDARARIAELESDPGSVGDAEQRRARETIAEKRDELQQKYRARETRLDRRAKKLKKRKRRLDSRSSKLAAQAAELEARAAELAAVEAAAPEIASSDDSAGSGCHDSYTGACVPITSDVDCAGGSGNGPAYVGTVTVVGYDEYGLDADGDGVGCE